MEDRIVAALLRGSTAPRFKRTTALLFCAMLRPVSSGSFRKQLRCERCGRRLGTYLVLFAAGEARLTPIRFPQGMEAWNDSGPKPKVFSAKEASSTNRVHAKWGLPVNRYRWRCGCGAESVWRGDTLFKRWSRHDGVEAV
jgi:hypothetical protein